MHSRTCMHALYMQWTKRSRQWPMTNTSSSSPRGHRGVRESCRTDEAAEDIRTGCTSRRPPEAFENHMHTRASFDAAKDARTDINAEAIVTCDRASKYTRASSRTYLESSPTRSSRATMRLLEGSTVTPVHPASILEERMVRKQYEARLSRRGPHSD